MENPFQKQYVNTSSERYPLPQKTAEQGPLDFPICEEEIQLATYILRNGKSPGYDSISNEMLLRLYNVKPEIIKLLFNSILQNPMIINKWNISVISPLHKKGSKLDPDNYRAISLLSCFGTFFLAILKQRITKFAIEQNILSKGQLGFLSGNKTSDAHLIVHNLVNYYCTKEKKNIFVCFVDFQKAFDSVPRNKLFQKLLDYNINGKFYDCLTNLYTGDKSCVKLGDRVTSTFELTHGVKQGCILSPIFISDLQQRLKQKYCNPVNISSGVESGCLIWADDLLLMSKTEIGLQNMLKVLKKLH